MKVSSVLCLGLVVCCALSFTTVVAQSGDVAGTSPAQTSVQPPTDGEVGTPFDEAPDAGAAETQASSGVPEGRITEGSSTVRESSTAGAEVTPAAASSTAAASGGAEGTDTSSTLEIATLPFAEFSSSSTGEDASGSATAIATSSESALTAVSGIPIVPSSESSSEEEVVASSSTGASAETSSTAAPEVSSTATIDTSSTGSVPTNETSISSTAESEASSSTAAPEEASSSTGTVIIDVSSTGAPVTNTTEEESSSTGQEEFSTMEGVVVSESSTGGDVPPPQNTTTPEEEASSSTGTSTVISSTGSSASTGSGTDLPFENENPTGIQNSTETVTCPSIQFEQTSTDTEVSFFGITEREYQWVDVHINVLEPGQISYPALAPVELNSWTWNYRMDKVGAKEFNFKYTTGPNGFNFNPATQRLQAFFTFASQLTDCNTQSYVYNPRPGQTTPPPPPTPPPTNPPTENPPPPTNPPTDTNPPLPPTNPPPTNPPPAENPPSGTSPVFTAPGDGVCPALDFTFEVKQQDGAFTVDFNPITDNDVNWLDYHVNILQPGDTPYPANAIVEANNWFWNYRMEKVSNSKFTFPLTTGVNGMNYQPPQSLQFFYTYEIVKNDNTFACNTQSFVYNTATGGLVSPTAPSGNGGYTPIATANRPPRTAEGYTLCEKYTRELFGNANSTCYQTSLITALVKRTAYGDNSSTPVVEGLFGNGSALVKALSSVQFGDQTYDLAQLLNDETMVALIAQNLIELIGRTFGCKAQGFPDYESNPLFAASGYEYIDINKLRNALRGLNLPKEVFTQVQTQIIATLKSFGVSQSDIDRIAQPSLVGLFSGLQGQQSVTALQRAALSAATSTLSLGAAAMLAIPTALAALML